MSVTVSADRTVVPNAAGEDEWTPARTHSTMTPPCSTPDATAPRIPPARVDRVDGPHVMAVAARTGVPASEIDAERCAEQCLLGVVDGEGVAGEQHVDVAAANQLDEVGAAAGVHDDRAGDEGDLALPAPGVAHQRGDTADTRFNAALGRISLVMKPNRRARDRGTPA